MTAILALAAIGNPITQTAEISHYGSNYDKGRHRMAYGQIQGSKAGVKGRE